MISSNNKKHSGAQLVKYINYRTGLTGLLVVIFSVYKDLVLLECPLSGATYKFRSCVLSK